jgi:RNA polymerase sigma factor (sigma-70 family)
VDRVVAFIARRNGLGAADREELGSIVRLRLVENDHNILRRFEGRSRFETYLTTVVQRIFLDERIRRWGKWRPSAEARRLGPLAVRLQELMGRDGLPADQAIEVLRAAHGPGDSRDELRRLAQRIPVPSPRRFVGEDALEGLATSGEEAERGAREKEERRAASDAEAHLTRALAGLTSEERLLVKMRFQDSFTVAEIAIALRLPVKPLYRRFEALLSGLRRALESAGLTAPEIASLLDRRAFEDTGILQRLEAGGIRGEGPSNLPGGIATETERR